MKNKHERIMSGDYSRDMWDLINDAKTVSDLSGALYLVCCRLQELEGRFSDPGKAGRSLSDQKVLSRLGLLLFLVLGFSLDWSSPMSAIYMVLFIASTVAFVYFDNS